MDRTRPANLALCLGAATIVLCVGACEREMPSRASIDEVIALEIEPEARAPADGASTITLIARVPADANDSSRNIKLESEAGTFAGTSGKSTITLRANAEGVVEAELIAGQTVGTKYVSATVGDFTARELVEFYRARATSLAVETTSAFATVDGSVKPVLSAVLKREKGRVSVGTPVEFAASAGRIFDVTPTNDAGVATASYAADTAAVAPGATVTVSVRTENDSGETMTVLHEIKVR